jgi:hypothetical protein
MVDRFSDIVDLLGGTRTGWGAYTRIPTLENIQQFPLSLQAQESLGQLRWPFVNFEANIAPDLNDLRLS